MSDSGCPCGLGNSYETCCGPIHGGARAATALQVMRARYSAFAVGREDYLLASWHPDTRPAEVDLLVGDPAKARKVLDWTPKTNFEELVHMMVDADMALLSGKLDHLA